MNFRKQKPSVFVAIPTYDGRVEEGLIGSVNQAAAHGAKVVRVGRYSLLAHNFNNLWCQALNERKELGITHFAMIHSDIVPEPAWLQKMLNIMREHKADVLSAIVPLKGASGLTSTAVDRPTEDDPWMNQRLTLKELYKMSPTITDERLLINSGLMLVDFTQPWVEEIHFEINDQICKDPESGRFYAKCESEDWGFSRKAHKLGKSLYATREVMVKHIGQATFVNTEAWGSLQSDPNWMDAPPEETKKESEGKEDGEVSRENQSKA